MKRLSFGCAFAAVSLAVSAPAHAALSFDFPYFQSEKTERKFSAAPVYQRYASVSLLTDDNDLTFKPVETLDVKTRCQMSGYYMTKASCTSAGKRYGPRCSDDKNFSFSANFNHPMWLDDETGNTALMKNLFDYAYVDKNQTAAVYAYPIIIMEGK